MGNEDDDGYIAVRDINSHQMGEVGMNEFYP
jgi:hypothetical protein